MKKVYFVLGVVGLIGLFCASFYYFGQGSIVGGILCIFGMVSSFAFISLSMLMEENEKLKAKIDIMEDYLLTDAEYLNFISKLGISIENLVKKESFVDNNNALDIAEATDKKLEYAIGLLKNKEYSKAFIAFKESADEGNVNAYVYLGNCYMLGYGSVVDKTIATEWFEKAASVGLPDGKFFLGIAYLKGDGVAIDKNKGKELILEAASLGSAKATTFVKTHKLDK